MAKREIRPARGLVLVPSSPVPLLLPLFCWAAISLDLIHTLLLPFSSHCLFRSQTKARQRPLHGCNLPRRHYLSTDVGPSRKLAAPNFYDER